jgi:glutaryl-CoA dehydrogenase
MSSAQTASQPRVDGDFYRITAALTKEESAILARVRAFMETEVAPIINDYWSRAKFPFELVAKLRELGIGGTSYEGFGCAGGSNVLNGLICMELSRVDPSFATFYGVHSGLSMGSIYLCGSDEQKQRWLPPMARLEKIGAFGLTEPEVGSAASGGLTTTAKRDGQTWILNGQKKWIGNATFADVTVIWARDEASNQVKGFLVEKGTPGFVAEKMENKIALRVVQNALITLTDCRVLEANRLQNANSFKDTARVLRMTRAGVAWFAVGCQLGAYEYALKYAQRRLQFGKPIASFQLVQDLLVRMLGNITATQTMMLRLAQLQDQGVLHCEVPGVGWICARTAWRQRHPAGRERGTLCGGCRGDLFLRRNTRDEYTHRRQGHHGSQRLRLGLRLEGAPRRGPLPEADAGSGTSACSNTACVPGGGRLRPQGVYSTTSGCW